MEYREEKSTEWEEMQEERRYGLMAKVLGEELEIAVTYRTAPSRLQHSLIVEKPQNSAKRDAKYSISVDKASCCLRMLPGRFNRYLWGLPVPAAKQGELGLIDRLVHMQHGKRMISQRYTNRSERLFAAIMNGSELGTSSESI